MPAWIYFIHPPRSNFATTMTEEEKTVWAVHFERLQRLLADGTLVLAGPTLGTENTGVTVFEAPDEAAARRIMEDDPVVSGGFARGELRPFRISLLRGRDPRRLREIGDASAMTEAVVELLGVTVLRSGRPILADLDWKVGHGERWVVLGPNGSGKTTLLQVVSTYLWPSRGRVRVLGAEIGAVDARELRRAIGYASPALAATLDPDLSAADVVMTARHAALAPWWHTFSDADRSRARLLLERMGCGALGERTFGTLSSGERQRVQIARTLMSEPTLLLLDEPASGLDLGAREALAARLSDLAAAPDPAAIILVTHHVEEIPAGFSHALVLADGRAVASGPIARVLTAEVLTSAYGLPLEVAQESGRFRAWARIGTNGSSLQAGAAASSRARRRRTAGRMPPLP